MLERQRKLWGRFYLILLQYIYFTRIVPRLMSMYVSFRSTYSANIVEELGVLGFYILIGYAYPRRLCFSDHPRNAPPSYLFRPEPANMYLLVKDDEDEDDQDGLAIPMSNLGNVSKRNPTEFRET